METWITVVIAAIVAISTLGATWLTNRSSSKRFEKEHERAIVQYQRDRRREVRGEPLLKLRDALALMATRLHILVTNTQSLGNQSGLL